MHIKYRPKTREEVLGQDHILDSITLDRPALLHGPTGVGKTTIAYILANEFCPPENIFEIDCIKHSTKSDIEDVLNNFMKSSIFGSRKILLLDEIHGLSQSPKAQQSLLAPLESLPKDKKIIACTTELGTLKQPLIDRFRIYKLRHLSTKDLKKLLTQVCEKENIKLERWLKILLIEKSEGIARKLLTLLPVIKDITDMEEAEFLLDINSIDIDADTFNLFKLLLSGKMEWSLIVSTVDKLIKEKSAESVRIGLVKIICGRLKSKYVKSLDECEILVQSMDILNTPVTEDFIYNIIFKIYRLFGGL